MSLRAFITATAPHDYSNAVGRPIDVTIFGRWLEQTSPTYVWKDRVVRLRLPDVVNEDYSLILGPLIAGFDNSVQLTAYAILDSFASNPDMRMGRFTTA